MILGAVEIVGKCAKATFTTLSSKSDKSDDEEENSQFMKS
jgi:hypothetical protein